MLEADEVDASSAEEACAAIDVLACLRGHPGATSAGAETVHAWVASHPIEVPAALVDAGLATLARIAAPACGLHCLWAEAERLQDWLAAIDALRARLLAAPCPLPAPAPPPAPAGAVVRAFAALDFCVVPVNPTAPASAHYNALLAYQALGEHDAARACIARLHRHFANQNKLNLLWDLAVRDAGMRAADGELEAALADITPWRAFLAERLPTAFDAREVAIHIHAGALERAIAAAAARCAAAPSDTSGLVDLALLHARGGSPATALALLDGVDGDGKHAVVVAVAQLARGIATSRTGKADACTALVRAARLLLDAPDLTPARWPFLRMAAAWLAVELARTGRTDDAHALVAAIDRPLAGVTLDASLAAALSGADLVAAHAVARARAASPPSQEARLPEHPVTLVPVRGVHALALLEQYRSAFSAGSGPYPFLIGSAADVADLGSLTNPPADGGAAILAAAAALDLPGWFKEHGMRSIPRWPRQPAGPMRVPATLYDTRSGSLCAWIWIGLVEVAQPWEIFARLGFGGWNSCPVPAVQVALHAHWHARFGAEPVALGGDKVECVVRTPPADQKAALGLAREQFAYCPDFVEQGSGSAGRLGSSLLGAPYWCFSWD